MVWKHREEHPLRRARSSTAMNLSTVAATVRRHDRDRFQTALFAPPARREALFALYAFNYEIARVRDSVREPAIGRIRLEWWREAIDDAYGGALVPRHPVVEALTEVIRKRAPARAHFDRLIDARAADLDDVPPANMAALEDYADGTSSRLVLLALEVLGVNDPAAAETGRHAGIAYVLAGLLRAAPSAARIGRRIIPGDIAARAGLDPDDWCARRGTSALRAATAEIAATAGRHLQLARAARWTIPHQALAALLPTVIAARSLRRLARARYDPFDPRLAPADPLQSWALALAALCWHF
jgi:NADH dehydrogenase [ubiquinone] 1 alpha subcomplex assembly factor 6